LEAANLLVLQENNKRIINAKVFRFMVIHKLLRYKYQYSLIKIIPQS